MRRTTADKIRIFRSCFSGLDNVYGTYDVQTGRVRQAKELVTDKVFYAHLTGKCPYGVYLLKKDKTGAIAVDFDTDDLTLPIAFLKEANKYGIPASVERSKSKGYHVWIFAKESGVSASKARTIVRKILDNIGAPEIEIFPKQDMLNDDVSYGNFINAPLFGKFVPQGRTVFINPDDANKPYPNQWDLLENVHRVSEASLDEIIRTLKINDNEAEDKTAPSLESDEPKNQISCFGLPPCAQKILAEGVNEYQRVVCFRLATHLKRSGIPLDLALFLLKKWAEKNHPTDGKCVITPAEIEEQTKYAYSHSYRGFGCEETGIKPYCSERCRLYPYTKKILHPTTEPDKKSDDTNHLSVEEIAK